MRRRSAPPIPERSTRAACAAILLVAALFAARPNAALAVCTYNPLTPGVPTGTPDATTLYSFSAGGDSWGAIGVRSAAGSEHSLGVFAQTAASPTCVQNSVGSSALPGGVDFVVGDFRPGRNAIGPWYAQANRTSGSGTALAEWDSGGVELVVDAPPEVHNTDHVLNVYNVFLEGGVTYVIVFTPSAGVTEKALLFRNPGTTGYWAPRSGKLLETSGVTSYQAPVSDEYALVVVNDDGGLSSYSLAVDQCQPPIALTSGTAVTTSPPLRYTEAQTDPYWSACAVRGNGTDDWDMLAYRTGYGTLEPECFKDTLAVSARRGPGVDLVAGDFNANPSTAYFTRAIQFSGSAPGVVEWDNGPDEISLNAPPVARTTGPGDVIEIWDVSMTLGSTYSIYFQKSGAADLKFLVFENPLQETQGTYWTGRNGAVLTGSAITDYAPTATGFHGLAVINENGGVGSYQLAVYGAASGVGDPAGTDLSIGIQSIRPNPTLGRATITYRVGKPGRVAFDLIDVAGRQVSRVAEFDGATGAGQFAFETRGGGRRLPGGIYFVRMTLGGTTASIRKFILLP